MPLSFEDAIDFENGEHSKLNTSLELSHSLFQPIVNCIQFPFKFEC